ncbi:MAG TPA: DNA translocase FtsK 4TM domain-containing protein, partial [Steroidobacteraceae bacterium]|nr:DNA translocase FtsK 4TM domain-containing protein [Steroidobacteraceae bacterium]
MAETQAQARGAWQLTTAVSRGLRESAIIALVIIGLVLFVALASYSPDDPGFSFSGNATALRNRIGVVGAWVADVLFFLFGRPAYLLPLAIGTLCIGLQRRLKGASASRADTAVRIVGFLLVLISSCALATLHWEAGPLRQGAGGVVGSLVGGALAAAVNFLGATLLMIAAWMAGLSLAFGVSWLTIMDRIGTFTWGTLRSLRERLLAARAAAAGRERRQARKESVEILQKKAAARSPPRIEPPPATVEKSARVERERQVPLFDPPDSNELPPLKLLDDPPPREPSYSPEALEALSRLVEMKLKDFAIEAEVVAVQPGPVVTRFELRPAPGIKASQITALAKDLARALSVLSVRVVEVIPGKSVMGLEIANEKREVVTLGEIIRSKAYDEMHSPLALALGKDIGGQPVVADLTRMPHLLIAGTTGSGKSVGLNA